MVDMIFKFVKIYLKAQVMIDRLSIVALKNNGERKQKRSKLYEISQNYCRQKLNPRIR